LYLAFENYLQNELNPEDKIAFENQLQSDADFKEKFEIYKASTLFMKHTFSSETLAFTDNLKSISKTHFKENKPKVFAFKPWQYAVAASVAVLFGVFFMHLNGNPEYGDYNQHEEAFNAKKYQEAIPFFEAVLKVNNSPEVLYFYGISLLELNKRKQAETVFTALQLGNSVYKTKAIWSLALIKLQQKDYANCKTILKTIPADYEDFDKVQQLLKELE
jgi:tetratricopeptide (TPR) repeat protein